MIFTVDTVVITDSDSDTCGKRCIKKKKKKTLRNVSRKIFFLFLFESLGQQMLGYASKKTPNDETKRKKILFCSAENTSTNFHF